MNIGIDARILNENITGINRFLWNLLKYIPQFDKINKYILYTYEDPPYKDDFYAYTKTHKKNVPRQIFEHYWLNFTLPKYLIRQQIDLFFTPYILVPLKRGKNKNVIVLHDAMTKACGEFYTYHYRKYMDIIVPSAIKRSDAIITDSESARQDIIKYYGVSPRKIHYMHLWTDEKYKPMNYDKEQKELLLKKYNLPEKYVLFVGVIEERKNIRGILKISDILASQNIDIKFVLAGRKGLGFDKLHDMILKRSDRIIYLNYIDEKTLPLLYNLATIFLFPSYYEGFGLPPLEAMKCGIPVLSSNNSSLIEVVGEGGMLSDADDYDAFAQNIISLLKNDTLYAESKSKALQQAKNFVPESQMPKLIDIFNELK